VTKIKDVLTQKGLKIFCETFHIPDDVHPQLPSPSQTIHEMPTGKIGVYTRFSEYANFRLPLSTFLINVLRYYRINLSQLFVIAAAKVSHFEILCRVHGVEPTIGLLRCLCINSKNKGWMSFSKRPDSDAVCYTKPLDSLKRWNNHFFWVDSFSCPASFPWHTGKTVSRDPFPKLRGFRADDYAVFVAHPAPFQKYPEPFLCLIGMSRNYTLDEDTYPTFLHDDGTIGYMDLFTFIHVADPTKVKVGERERNEGEARLLDSTVGHVVLFLPVALARVESELEASVERIITEENVATEKPKCPRKKRQAATDAGGSFHPPKKLRSDYGTSSGAVNAGPNLCLIGASKRFVITSDSSHHSSTYASGVEGDSIIRSAVVPPVMTEAVITTNAASIPSALAPKPSTKVITLVHASMFHDFDSTGTVRPDAAGSSYVSGKELSMGFREVDSEKFSVGTARQACLSAEVRMRTEYCLSERRRLESEFEKQVGLLKAKDDEAEGLKARLLLKEAEAAKAIRLRAEVTDLEASVVAKERELTDLNSLITYVKSQNDILVDRVHEFETSSSRLQEKVTVYENCMEQLVRFQDDRMKVVNDKWLLAQGMKLTIVKCLNSPEYLSALGAAISKAIEKCMQDGLSARISHGKEAYYDQLMVPIHHSLDKVVIGATALTLALDVSSIQVQKIRENTVNQISALRDVFVPLAEPFSTVALTSMENTSDIISAAANTTMALSITLASASTVPLITIEDYEVMGTDGPEDAQGSGQCEVTSFPNTVEFENEELDTTPERNPPS
nr:putative transposase (putative), gypsy type [Tanacetum cinerariifolium]